MVNLAALFQVPVDYGILPSISNSNAAFSASISARPSCKVRARVCANFQAWGPPPVFSDIFQLMNRGYA